MKNQKSLKLKKKIDLLFWAFMYIMPFFVYFVSYFHNGSALSFNDFISPFVFPFLETTLNQIWQLAFGSALPIAGYISYLVMVEVVHCLFDAVVFIPRIAHSFIDKFVDFAGGD